MKKIKKIASLFMCALMLSGTMSCYTAFADSSVTLRGTYTTIGSGNGEKTALVTAKDTVSGKTYSADVTEEDGTGSYSLDLPSGVYDVTVQKHRYLAKNYNRLKVGNVDMTIPESAILPGDLNSDGRVDTKDLAVIMRGMNSDEAYAVLRENADLDGDGILNVTDIGYLKANYNKTTDNYEWTNVMNLRTDYRDNPMGIDYENPTLSWILDSAKRGVAQASYNIGVASSFEKAVMGDFDVWESGETESTDTAVPYGGSKLEPMTRYYWTVVCRDSDGNVIPTSEIAEFETGLMSDGFGENNKWISADNTWISSKNYTLELSGKLKYNPKSNYSGFDFCVSPYHKDNNGRYRIIMQLTPNYSQFRVVAGMQNDNFNTISLIQNFHPNPGAYWNKNSEVKLKMVASNGTCNFYLTGIGYDEETLIHTSAMSGSGYDFSELGTVCLEYSNAFDIASLVVTDNDTGKVIFDDYPRFLSHPSLFRNEFTLDDGKTVSDIASARLYSTAAGNQIMYLNGERAFDDYYAPGKTQYTTVMYYQTHDVKEFLQNGTNTIAAEVGHGWYNAGPIGARYGAFTALRAKLVITYNDGTKQIVDTDSSWLGTNDGHSRGDRFYIGHYIDGNKYIENWNDNGCDTGGTSKWLPVTATDVFKSDAGYTISNNFIGENMDPVRCMEVLEPVSVTKLDSDSYVYKFEKNVAGTTRVTAKAPKNTKIRLIYGEWLEADGTVSEKQYLGQNGVDTYVFTGSASGETVEFDLALHGFQYVQIDGLGKAAELEALVLSSDIAKTGSFESSNPLVDKYAENAFNSIRGNFISSIIDCPTREKNTWTGDSGIFSSAAGYLADVYHIYRNFSEMGRLSQTGDGAIPEIVPSMEKPSPDSTVIGNAIWGGDTFVMIGYEMYHQYGDISYLTDNYDTFTKWIDYVFTYKVSDSSEVEDTDRFNYIKDAKDLRLETNYGDWLNYYGTIPGKGYRCLQDGTTSYIWAYTSHAEMATAYTAYSCMLVAEMAQILADNETDAVKKEAYLEDVQTYKSYHARLAKAWRTNFVKEDGFSCVSGGTSLTSAPYTYTEGEGSQTSYAMGIMFDLYENEEMKKKAADKLASLVEKDGYITTTGFPGIHILYEALTEYGHFDTALRMMKCTKQPSMLYPITQGATTIWETYYGTVNSRNHYSFGSASEWLYKYILGIDHGYNAEKPAFRHFMLHPNYDIYSDLTYAKGELMTYSGKIKAEWKLSDDKKTFTYDVEIPANTSATIELPTHSENFVITESGLPVSEAEGLTYIETKDGKACFEALSGIYSFKVENIIEEKEYPLAPQGENAFTYAELADENYGFSGRWYDRSIGNTNCYGSYTIGSEVYFAVEGTSNVTMMVTGECSAELPAYLAVSVDGGQFERICAPNGRVTLATGLDTDMRHTIRVILESHYLYQANKWHLGYGFAFERAIVDKGGNIIGLKPLEKTILYYGDSITEGVGSLMNDTTGKPEAHSALGAFPYSISEALGAVSFTNGYGATGILSAGCAGVPRCIETFDKCYLGGADVNYPENPGAIVLNHGQNDGTGYTSEDFITEYKALLAKFTEKFPNTPVFCIIPFSQRRSDDIGTALDEYMEASGRDDMYIISTADYFTNVSEETTDGVHLKVETAKKFGKSIAEDMESILGAGYFDAN